MKLSFGTFFLLLLANQEPNGTFKKFSSPGKSDLNIVKNYLACKRLNHCHNITKHFETNLVFLFLKKIRDLVPLTKCCESLILNTRRIIAPIYDHATHVACDLQTHDSSCFRSINTRHILSILMSYNFPNMTRRYLFLRDVIIPTSHVKVSLQRFCNTNLRLNRSIRINTIEGS